MDRHDAKPRRPSLMAGAEAQRPAPGQPPARILADMDPTPATRKPRRPTRLRAALVAGMGLLAIAAVGWALVTPGDGDAVLATPVAPRAVVDVPAEPSTATLVEAPATINAPVSNPFESGAASAEAAVDAPAVAALADAAAATAAAARPSPPPTETINPFSAMQATPARPAPLVGAPRPAPAGATRPAAAGPTAPATPRGAAPQASKEPGLLQTLMDNIQQPSEPARDTRGMDRLARRLDRAPMPEASAAGAAVVASAAVPARKRAPTAARAPAAVPTPALGTSNGTRAAAPVAAPAPATQTGTSPASTPEKQSLRAMLDRCPVSTSVQGQRCRRQMCERAGVDARRCLRH